MSKDHQVQGIELDVFHLAFYIQLFLSEWGQGLEEYELSSECSIAPELEE